MMLMGRLFKESAGWWGAEVPMVAVFTQGRTRKDAAAMLADAFASLINRPGFKVTATDYGDDQGTVAIEASDPSVFVAWVLQRLREGSGLSLADVAKTMGKVSRNAYARYEQGDAVPTIDKLEELLRAVSADTALIIGPRKPARSSAKPSRAPKARRPARGRAWMRSSSVAPASTAT